MRITNKIWLPILAAGISLCSCKPSHEASELQLIPVPDKVTFSRGTFDPGPALSISSNLTTKSEDEITGILIRTIPWLPIEKTPHGQRAALHFTVDSTAPGFPEESYKLKITRRGISMEARDEAGLFYGIQTLAQVARQYGIHSLPVMEIDDSPRFAYRGIHLDVSRHFFPKEFIMRQLDVMARYKLNRLHWHLTDGAGWRIEIKKYPLLTETAAWRPVAEWKEWYFKSPRRYCKAEDPGAYGGYYTRQDIIDVIEYARKLHITVIPEIELPGHSEEVLAVYPHLSCSGRPYVNGELCPGNEAVFAFLEDVLIEVMEIFPSEYIHIGGDEASHKAWEKCPRCRKRMKEERLKETGGLQDYMTRRIGEFLASHGRKLIGWDEILGPGLRSDAAIMFWRDAKSALEAIKAGHQAIIAPTEYYYLNYYQDSPLKEPEAMAGYTPLKKTYSFDPVPDSVPDAQRRLVAGIQGNLWTEYIPSEARAEYMLYPRMLAIAETGWSDQHLRQYPYFTQRVTTALKELRKEGVNAFDLTQEFGSREESKQPCLHLAKGKTVIYNSKYGEAYPAGGDSALVDGVCGDWYYTDHRWQGFPDCDMDITVDLGTEMEFDTLRMTFMQDVAQCIWIPASVTFLLSHNGREYKTVYSEKNNIPQDDMHLSLKTFHWAAKERTGARFIKVIARSNRVSHDGWIFTDEIIVN